MPKFIIPELQRVIAQREVEASDEDEATRLFDDGEGVPCKRDGDVLSAELTDITRV